VAAQGEIAQWILTSMSSGVVAIDAQGAVAMLNPGAQRILGCPKGEPGEILGKHCLDALAAQPAIARLLLSTLDGRAALSRAELVLEGAQGRLESTIGFTLTPVRDANAEVCGAAILFRDLTPFERMDEQERLRERLAALGQMAAGLAHEIRNPLAGMEVMTGLLKRRLTDRVEEQSLVDQLQGELRSLARTVTDCLDFVRPISPERGSVDLENLVSESLETCLARVPFDGAIDCGFEEELPPLNVDSDQLRVVLTNLILNALESMDGDNGGRAKRLGLGLTRAVGSPMHRSVRVAVDGSAAVDDAPRTELVITVSDTGPGVPSELREKVFYPFFSTKQKGSGVGLATAQKIIASHGGALELDTRSDTGCSFRVHLPVGVDKP
jgi:signal transduction histidine kinase